MKKMTKTIEELVIDEEYVRRVGEGPDYKQIDRDFAKLRQGGKVLLVRPRNPGLLEQYFSIMDQVCLRAVRDGYGIKPGTEADLSRAMAICGNSLYGNMKDGYYFRRAA